MPESGELSEREIEILQYLVNGSPNKAIAAELHISPNTVKVHIRNIYKKLDATSRADATRIALEQRLVPLAGAVVTPPAKLPAASQPAPPETDGTTAVPIDTPTQSKTKKQRNQWQMLTFGLTFLAVVLGIGLLSLNPFRSQPTPTPPPTPFPEIEIGGNWSSSAPLPEGRKNMAATAIGLEIYIIGGETDAGIDNSVQVFDTVTRIWRSGTTKPTAVSDASAAVLFGEIFVPGGRLADGSLTEIVEVYSPANNAWRTVASLPEPVAGGLTLSDGGFIYLFGGETRDGVSSSAYVYDINVDRWRPLAGMAIPRSQAAGGEINGLIYVVGGENETGALTKCERFDPGNEVWSACLDMLQARTGAGAAALVNKLYVIGGTAVSEELVTLTEEFDPQTETWQFVNTPMNELTQWEKPAVTRVESRIYAMGGMKNGHLIAESYIYAPLSYRTYLPAASGGN